MSLKEFKGLLINLDHVVYVDQLVARGGNTDSHVIIHFVGGERKTFTYPELSKDQMTSDLRALITLSSE